MSYTFEEIAAFLRVAGVPPSDAIKLTAVTTPESGRADVIQQGQPYSTTGWGVWQITPGDSEPQFGVNDALLNPVNNARAAWAKYQSQGIDAWTTWTSGKAASYIPQSEQAVQTAYNLSPSQLQTAVSQAGASGSGGTQPATLTNWLDPKSWIGDFFGLGFKELGFGSPNWGDLFERAGLILLGAALILLGIFLMATNKTLNIIEKKAKSE